ncbi:MAG: 3-methyl-2-oxobutanoate hydroxymethyltransferase [Candidatus Riflebacteria bacterium]|nr:3-methyl-2-oxobutanoate hydroxymethyltransferase [Candidatus Riflebacteria bacterium]
MAKTVIDFTRMKAEKRRISMVTSYDYWSAKIINKSDVDAILVGDSLAMVMHGHSTTIPADINLMALHTNAVVKGAPEKLIVADMPFLSVRKGIADAVENAGTLCRAGAAAVKIEGLDGHEDVIIHLIQSGIPVMGHLGLTPQSIHAFGGYKVQAVESDAQHHLVQCARRLEQIGVFSIVLECVPQDLAGEVTRCLSIPTIGIGAGPDVDGQILVLQDMLGMDLSFKPKFLRTFLEGENLISEALNKYSEAVKSRTFPDKSESYS